MALIRCPDCSREVSHLASTCPHCGRPVDTLPAASAADATLAAPAQQLTPAVPGPQPGPRQLTPRATPISPAAKPVAGIATVLVLGTAGLVWASLPAHPEANSPVEALGTISRGLQILANMGVIVGALMALMGNRAGHRVVRTTAWLMIPFQVVLLGIIAVLLSRVSASAQPGARGALLLLVAMGGIFLVGPWLLYLHLFRRSRYG